MNLTCSEFAAQLDERCLDGESLDEAALAAHAQACPPCAQRWESERTLDSAIVRWREAVPRSELADRILARLAFETPQDGDRPALPRPAAPRLETSPGPSENRFAAPAAIAAAALILLLVAGAFYHSASTMIVVPIANQPAAPGGKPAEFSELVQDAGNAYRALYAGAVGPLVAAPSETPQDLPSPEVVRVPPALSDSTAERLASEVGWIEEWREGLRPVGNQFSGTFDFLLDTVAETQPQL